ncbi:MAG: hypothetical protein WAN33_01050 [Candidatus Acidiferrales bacterium]
MKNGADRAVNGNLLVVTRRFSGKMVVRGEETLYDLARYVFSVLQALPEFVRRGKVFESAFETGHEIVLDDPVTVCGVGKLQAKDLGVPHRLGEAIGRFLVIGFGFNDGDSKIRPIAEEIIGSFLLTTDCAAASNDDPAIGESSLLVDVVVGPAGSVQLREDILSTSVGFRK